MDFTLSDEQKMLREGAERYLADNYSFEQRKTLLERDQGFSEAQWQQFAEMGWLALPLREESGGLGGSFVDISLIQESLGARLVLEPFASTAILSAYIVEGGGDAVREHALLQSVASGETRIALAHGEMNSRYGSRSVATRAMRAASGFELTGHKMSVWDAPHAHHFIVSAVLEGESALSLFLVAKRAAGSMLHEYSLIDSTRAADVSFTATPAALLLPSTGALPRLEAALDRMTLAQVAESLGIMETVLDITAEQLRNRSQFGQPLAKFQALQHRMAEMFVEVQETRSILYRGIAFIEASPNERQAAVSAAKVVAIGAARVVGGQGIQLHGGVGMTDEYPVGHYFKRLLAIEKQYGDMEFHLGRMAETRRSDDNSAGR